MNTCTEYMMTCAQLHITESDAETLRRAALTLHRISEQECNGTLYFCDEPTSDYEGKPLSVGKFYHVTNISGPGPLHYSPTADRETGARQRVEAIAGRLHAKVEYQDDPRGWPFHLTFADGLTLYVPPVRK